MKKILLIVPIVILIAAGCSSPSSQQNSSADQITKTPAVPIAGKALPVQLGEGSLTIELENGQNTFNPSQTFKVIVWADPRIDMSSIAINIKSDNSEYYASDSFDMQLANTTKS